MADEGGARPGEPALPRPSPGWAWRCDGGVGFWRADALERHGCGAVFSSRLGGVSAGPYATLNLGASVGDAPERVAANRERLRAAAGLPPPPWAIPRQVHGAAVVVADTPGDLGPADAAVTAGSRLCLAVVVADCLAVYLLDPVRRACALCHAGWRGTVADVVGAAVRELTRRFGSRPGDLLAAVSPGIGPCCYEVDAPVIGALRAAVEWADEVLLPARPGAPPGRRRLDLARACHRRLTDAGVPPGSIWPLELCTACHPALLFSHRRDRGHTGRMLAALHLA